LFGLDHLETRKAWCRLNELPYAWSWVLLITDGMPQGEPLETTRLAIRRIRNVEWDRQAAFVAIDVGGANVPLLARIAVRPPSRLLPGRTSRPEESRRRPRPGAPSGRAPSPSPLWSLWWAGLPGRTIGSSRAGRTRPRFPDRPHQLRACASPSGATISPRTP